MNGEAGKGDNYRKVDWNKYSENYDHIFKKSKNTDQNDESNKTLNNTVDDKKVKQ